MAPSSDASSPPLLLLISMIIMMSYIVQGGANTVVGTASWCVARSDATEQALQTALDYACSSGADCTPIQSSGLCYLPNTIQHHSSYAFNSYYQRKGMAPGSCDFAGTANIAKSDPSYGSCVYPASQSAAGGIAMPTTPPATPGLNPPTIPGTNPGIDVGTGGLSPGLNPDITGTPAPNYSTASLVFPVTAFLMPVALFLVL